jgi:DNA-binding transcriptional MerR regulator
MGTHQSIRKTVTPEIPDKLYFRIGDVALLCEVPAYVLRFWETEFPQLKPNKGGTGQRLYRKRDVEMALRIKSLLYDQGYTIPGARQVFKNEAKPREVVTPFESATAVAAAAAPALVPAEVSAQSAAGLDKPKLEGRLRALRKEMQELLAMLGSTTGSSTEPAGPRVKALRPRLVTEPRAATLKAATPKAATPKIALKTEPGLPVRPEPRLIGQGDLFPVE